MRKILYLIVVCCIGISASDATVRSTQNDSGRNDTSQTVVGRSTTTLKQTAQKNSVRSATSRTNKDFDSTKTTVQARSVTRKSSERSTRSQDVIQRTPTISNTGSSVSTTTPSSKGGGRTTVSRATTNAYTDTIAQTFGSDYVDCRDAYFTCMDQFCAKQNETYRRCICSSRISDIKSRENALKQTEYDIETFTDLNLYVIDKTSAEASAITTSTVGENAIKKDTSASAGQLSNITSVLNKTKNKALATSGTLDIGGDISTIWSTTDLTSGANIANLTGDALYNAVHSQCVALVESYCPTSAIKSMVTSAYGMYIENDCNALLSALNTQLVTAKGTIRDTEHEVQLARLENYNKHNSSSINECISKIRTDITANTACGSDYVHCLDVTHNYLNYETGAPIYTSNFYLLGSQLSLSGDILTNPNNTATVKMLNDMRIYATNSLNTCSDISDNIWDEFMRQAIQEIYQEQQLKVTQVKSECLDVVNECYDEMSGRLKDFTNSTDYNLSAQQMELSEEMCKTKLSTCTNLYGGNVENLLLAAMHNVVDQKIASDCLTSLRTYAKKLCDTVDGNPLYSYPYNCRMYTPGKSENASVCPFNQTGSAPEVCSEYKNSLYYKMARYTTEVCVRPSDAETNDYFLPTTILADINTVMTEIRTDMAAVLASECTRLDGKWVMSPLQETDVNTKHIVFYRTTNANTDWGYCAAPETQETP